MQVSLVFLLMVSLVLACELDPTINLALPMDFHCDTGGPLIIQNDKYKITLTETGALTSGTCPCNENSATLCPNGWQGFLRDDNSMWCSQIRQGALSWAEAEADCVRDGAHLAGFESSGEYAALLELSFNVSQTSGIWLGGKRKAACQTPQYSCSIAADNGADDTCGIHNVYGWENSVARGSEMGWKWALNYPAYTNCDDICLVLRQQYTNTELQTLYDALIANGNLDPSVIVKFSINNRIINLPCSQQNSVGHYVCGKKT
ncbi:unnamed protein product [Caenorhabditis auriculariae]|uniref:C-type lectin domain-containing protein n=1 Tax=Caenorhabditis auriculariae TaxID=2777116 RepID=A0A8S1HKF9_9PELO|nr:unnamed protein product [Caenorhabditis auriculariae]